MEIDVEIIENEADNLNIEIESEVVRVPSGSEVEGKDGVSPTVDVIPIPDGHRVVITDAEGPKSFDVKNGKDGFSPIINVTEIEGGHRVNITDKENTETFDILNSDIDVTAMSNAKIESLLKNFQ